MATTLRSTWHESRSLLFVAYTCNRRCIYMSDVLPQQWDTCWSVGCHGLSVKVELLLYSPTAFTDRRSRDWEHLPIVRSFAESKALYLLLSAKYTRRKNCNFLGISVQVWKLDFYLHHICPGLHLHSLAAATALCAANSSSCCRTVSLALHSHCSEQGAWGKNALSLESATRFINLVL